MHAQCAVFCVNFYSLRYSSQLNDEMASKVRARRSEATSNADATGICFVSIFRVAEVEIKKP